VKPESGGGQLLHRHVTPLPRRYVVYFCSGAQMGLLIGGELDRKRILDALNLTFERRETHPLPAVLDAPPSEWTIPFQALATECGMQPDLAAAFERVAKFYQEVRSDASVH
jgi:hypothetical protein